jgi:hypothetical protein
VELTMPTINQLPLITQLSGGDNVVLWVPNQGDSRRASITTLIQYIEANLGNVVAQTVQTSPVVYSQLPNASDAGAGTRAYVTDSITATFGATIAGGGANAVPVYSDGTDWKVG